LTSAGTDTNAAGVFRKDLACCHRSLTTLEGTRRPVIVSYTKAFSRLRDAAPLYEQLADVLRQKVASGELGPGARLPGEMELALMLGVSRPSVREAIKILQALGIVTVRHGAGVYVTTADASEIASRLRPLAVLPPSELHQIYEVRKSLECQAAAWAAHRITSEETVALRDVMAQMRALTELPQMPASPLHPPLDRLEQLDSQFHYQLALTTHNAVLLGLMNNMMELIRESRRYSLGVPGRAIQSVYDHQRIFDAVAAHEPLAAARAMFAHLDGVEKAVFRERAEPPTGAHDGSILTVLSVPKSLRSQANGPRRAAPTVSPGLEVST